jgi:hypothetical protein
VPHVEAVLQLRSDTRQAWDARSLAARLYLSAERAAELLADLCAIGIARLVDTQRASYRYDPATVELGALLDQLEQAYSTQLVAVARLIHSAEQRKAQHFADAFRFRKDD